MAPVSEVSGNGTLITPANVLSAQSGMMSDDQLASFTVTEYDSYLGEELVIEENPVTLP